MSKRAVQLGVAAGVLVFLATFAALLQLSRKEPRTPGRPTLEQFAQCLTDKGAVMYGAYWCPHCQNQKAMFGEAFKFIRYVECTQDPQPCIDAGIRGFPSWIFPGGVKLEGTQFLQQLAKVSGCPLPDAAR